MNNKIKMNSDRDNKIIMYIIHFEYRGFADGNKNFNETLTFYTNKNKALQKAFEIANEQNMWLDPDTDDEFVKPVFNNKGHYYFEFQNSEDIYSCNFAEITVKEHVFDLNADVCYEYSSFSV